MNAAQPIDVTGEATLELFRENDAYTELIWKCLSGLLCREVAGRVLEVGCGIGNLTRILLRSRALTYLHAIDLDPAYVRRVQVEVADPRLEVTASPAEDFCPPEQQTEAKGFDVIVTSNVLEHIADHLQVLCNFRRLLRPGGIALVLVPAHPGLYSSLDRALSHYRRYRRRDVHELASRSGLRVVRMRHFNPVGALGWWLNGKVLRREVLPAGQLSLYARYAIPLSRLIDRLNPFPFGVSLLCALARA